MWPRYQLTRGYNSPLNTKQYATCLQVTLFQDCFIIFFTVFSTSLHFISSPQVTCITIANQELQMVPPKTKKYISWVINHCFLNTSLCEACWWIMHCFFKPRALGPPLHYGASQNILPSALYIQVIESFFIISLEMPWLKKGQNSNTKNLSTSQEHRDKGNNTFSISISEAAWNQPPHGLHG